MEIYQKYFLFFKKFVKFFSIQDFNGIGNIKSLCDGNFPCYMKKNIYLIPVDLA